MNTVNIFTQYDQLENHFTNGFVSILSLSRFECPGFVGSFLRDELGLPTDEEIDTFRVQPGQDGTADGELSGKECCVWFETKIRSGTLDAVQIRQHLNGDGNHRNGLKGRKEKLRRLVLLTPDDSGSRYIKEFLSIDARHVLHLEWKRTYAYLTRFVSETRHTTFSELVHQFLRIIRDMVFEQDLAGVIVKIHFGDESEVYKDRYLDEMKSGMWNHWNTPREYKSLDGTGRKLLLYDKHQGITAEVEIERVERTDVEADYPWTNEFAPGTLRFFEPPIRLDRIRSVKGFEHFGVYRKDRSPFRNITQEQYRQLFHGQPSIGSA